MIEEFTAEEREAAKRHAESCRKVCGCMCCEQFLEVMMALETAEAKLKILEGTTDHPENKCERCGGRNIVWSCDNDTWNWAAGKYSVLCPICFAEIVEELSPTPRIWRLLCDLDETRQEEQEKYARLGRTLMVALEAFLASGNSPEDPRGKVVDGYIAGYGKMLAERDRLKERVEELEAKLYKTADDVYVVPDEDTVWHPRAGDSNGSLVALTVLCNGGASWWREPDVTYPIDECYSTVGAAEKAKEEFK